MSGQNAYAGEVSHFDVYLWYTQSIEIGEPVTLNIAAVDEAGDIVEDYTWSILVFSETDPTVILSNDLKDSVYKFTLEDKWVATFEDAIIFNSLWRQDLHVYDLYDDTDSIKGTGDIIVEREEKEIDFIPAVAEVIFELESDDSWEEEFEKKSLSQEIKYDNYIDTTSLEYSVEELSFINYLKSIIVEIEQDSYFPNDLSWERMDLADRRYLMTFNGDDWAGIGGTLAWEGIHPKEAYIIHKHISYMASISDIHILEADEYKLIIQNFFDVIEVETASSSLLETTSIETDISIVETFQEATQEEKQTVSEKLSDYVTTSFRKEKEYTRNIEPISIREVETEEQTVSEKLADYVTTSFRKEKEYTRNIEPISIREVDGEEQTASKKLADYVITSFRKVRDLHPFVKPALSDEERSVEEELKRTKMVDMIITSFRKVREPFVFVKPVSIEWEEIVSEESMDIITNSFRTSVFSEWWSSLNSWTIITEETVINDDENQDSSSFSPISFPEDEEDEDFSEFFAPLFEDEDIFWDIELDDL